MTTQLIIEPFVYMTSEFIERIEKDMSKVSMASYTKESLQNMVNNMLTNKIKKEKYISYCVGYIHDSVIHANMTGKTQFLHDYKISNFIYNSAVEFNDCLMEKLKVMFPDAVIIIKKSMLNLCVSNPLFYTYTLYIRW